MMPNNQRIREVSMHPLHQFAQRTNLLGSAGISSIPCRVKPTLVADADRVLVMSYDMSTHLFQPSADKDLPLAVHPEVIAYTLPSLRLVVGINLLHAVMLPGPNPITMQYDKSNFSHNLKV